VVVVRLFEDDLVFFLGVDCLFYVCYVSIFLVILVIVAVLWLVFVRSCIGRWWLLWLG